MIAIVVFVFCALATVNGLPFVNLCPAVDGIKDLDLNKFSGTWYEIQRIWYEPNITTRCNKETYQVDPETMLITISAEFLVTKTNASISSNGTAAYNDNATGEWDFIFPKARAGGILKVLNTDYNNFAVFYTCQQADVYTIELAWLALRNRVSSIKQAQFPYDAAQFMGNSGYIVNVDQKDCDNWSFSSSTEEPTSTYSTTQAV